MGSVERRPKNYWRNIENVKKEIQPLIDKYGRFPSNNEMIKDHGTSLPKYIVKYHGGIIEFSKIMGVQCYDQSIGRRVQNTWNKKDVISEYLKIIQEKETDYYPTRKELMEWGYDIYVGITQTFDSYFNFKNYLKTNGINLKSKPKNKLWDEESIKIKLHPFIEKLGYFPSQSELDNFGLSTIRRILSEDLELRDKIIKDSKVKLKPRMFSEIRNNGRWRWTKDNVKEILSEIHSKYGRILSNKEMKELGYGSIYHHYDKLDNEFLETLDFFETSTFLKTKDGHKVLSLYELLFDNFLSWNNITHKTEGLISNEIDDKYRYDFLLDLNQTKVYVEVWGYSRDRTELEINYKKKRILKEKVYQKLNLNLLSVEDSLFDKPFNDMYIEFSKLIQIYDNSFVPKDINLEYLLYGSKHSIDDVINELKVQIELNDGFFPSSSILRKNGLEGLISKIQKYGGMDFFKGLLGVDLKKTESKWTLDFLKNEIEKVNGLKYLPSPSELKSYGRVDIQGGIQKNGGWSKVSKLLGIPTKLEFLENQPYEYQGKFSKIKIEEEINQIISEIGKFPNETDLKKLNQVSLYVGIKTLYGGLKNLKKEMGFFVKELVQVDVGSNFGELKVLELTNENLVLRVSCICSCGKEYETRLDNFRDRYRKFQEKLTCGRCKKTDN